MKTMYYNEFNSPLMNPHSRLIFLISAVFKDCIGADRLKGRRWTEREEERETILLEGERNILK